MKTMKSISVLLAFATLAACGPKKFGEEVRQVEVGQTYVDEDMGELYVDIKDVSSGQNWKVGLGEECRQYPLPMGERFMTRFDKSRYEDKPEDKNIYFSPQTTPIWNYLCG
jgi:hypothetical protein